MAKVLITGASRGLGRAMAITALTSGHHVIATARNMADLAGLAVDGIAMATTLELDVTSDESIAKVAAQVKDLDIDIIINNAAFSIAGPLEAIPSEVLSRLLNINVTGPLRVNNAFLPAMRKRKSGVIVNISSGTVKSAPPLQGAYAVSKNALNFYSQTLRQEVSPFGIKVICVEPPGLKTAMVATQSHFQCSGYEEFIERASQLNAQRPELDVTTVAENIINMLTQSQLPEHISTYNYLTI